MVRFLSALIGSVLSTATLVGCASQTEAPEPTQAEIRYESLIGVQLFKWPWDSIAAECEFLGDSGVDWVLTSPPQEHITGAAWWTVYQPLATKSNRDLEIASSLATWSPPAASMGSKS